MPRCVGDHSAVQCPVGVRCCGSNHVVLQHIRIDASLVADDFAAANAMVAPQEDHSASELDSSEAEEAKEAGILSEMQAVKDEAEKRRKKERKKRREARMKSRIRAAQMAMGALACRFACHAVWILTSSRIASCSASGLCSLIMAEQHQPVLCLQLLC